MKNYTLPSLIATLILLVMMSMASSAQAQTDQTTFGAKAGFTAFSLTTSNGDSETSDLRLGWTVGGYANIPFSETFSFQPELIFTQKGGQESSSEGDVNIILSYIDLPLLLRFNIPLETEVLPYITAGPTLGYMVNANVKFEDNGNSASSDIEDAYNDFNVGLSLGVGLALRQFSIDYRYEFGLTDLIDDDAAFGFGSEVTQKTNGFTVTLGYTF